MKRSEMLVKLKSEIRCNAAIQSYIDGDISKGRCCEVLSEAVLGAIEETGMLPPFAMKYHRQGIYSNHEYHKWEQE